MKTCITGSTLARFVFPRFESVEATFLKLLSHILERVNKTLRRPKRLSQAALSRLQGHAWPGNVRELHNVIERSARLTGKEVIDADDLVVIEPAAQEDPLSALPEPTEGFSLEGFLASARKQLLLKALELARGNQSEAAKFLGISPQAVSKFTKSLLQRHVYNPG